MGTLTGAAGAQKGEPIVAGRFIIGKERPRAILFGYSSPSGATPDLFLSTEVYTAELRTNALCKNSHDRMGHNAP